MKPLDCCKDCDRLNEDGTFKNKLRCMLSCDKYANEQCEKIYNEQKHEKGCSTCKNCKRIYHYPDFVTAEECECTVGLKCDTVLFSITNCPNWVENR